MFGCGSYERANGVFPFTFESLMKIWMNCVKVLCVLVCDFGLSLKEEGKLRGSCLREANI